MDFLTHSLVGVGIGRIAAPSRQQFAAYSLAGMLGSLLPDSDSWLALLGPNMYGLYHRVITHSIVGLVACGTIGGLVAWKVGTVPKLQRFGWFVAPNVESSDAAPPHSALAPLIAVGIAGAVLHWCMDWITGFGNLKPFWPWFQKEYHLGAVQSFDAAIFATTLAWHIVVRSIRFPRRSECIIAAGYFALVSLYVFLRWRFGTPTVW